MEKGFAEVNNATFYYETAGVGPALVMVHGFTLDCRMWDVQFEYFARNYRVIRYDVRGFGKSSLPGTSYSHSEDMSALLEYLDVDSAHVMGLSMGGAIAIDFAFSRMNMVQSLVLADSSIGSIQPSEEAVSYGSMVPNPRNSDSVKHIKKVWLASNIFRPAMKKKPVAELLVQMVNDYSGYHWIYENPVKYNENEYYRNLEKINRPSLIVVGELDVPKHQEIADILANRIPGAGKAVIENAGHMSNMEEPDQFNRKVGEFLTSVS